MSSATALSDRDVNELAARIREAIREELRVSSRGIPFRASDVARQGGILYMTLAPEGRYSVLDESFEEGSMGWTAETSGSAEVISVIPALSLINAHLTSGQPPKEGSIVYVNPPRYLEALLDLWEQPAIAAAIARWLLELGKNEVTCNKDVPSFPFPGLRPAQKSAFDVLRWRTSFLWGPPGTGKTHTLGRMLASYLVHHPNDRVLLLSATNVAVDLAVLAVDDALAELKPAPRPVCLRFGSRLDPQRFQNRKHLTPLRDQSLLDKLRQHYLAIPDPADAERYEEWKLRRDRLRDAIRKENLEFLSRARLAAMTTTLAAHDFTNVGRFDLVIFDEASQVGKAQAATFAQLGQRVLFAGDHQQLAPIAQGATPDIEAWLGQSPFQWARRESLSPAMCMLDEQWRMARPISHAVSTLFYESKLRVADPLEADAVWQARRTPAHTALLGTDNVVWGIRGKANAIPG